MKAWHCCDTAIDGEAHLLVFAETANRARVLAFQNGTWDFEAYIYVRALRAPRWDGCFDHEQVVDTNDELPEGAPPFYTEEEYELSLAE